MNLEAAVERIQQTDTAHEAFTGFVHDLALFGFDKANHSFLTDHPTLGVPARFGIATSYPNDWVMYYAANGYENLDPVRHRGRSKSGAFLWSDATKDRLRDPSASQGFIDDSVRMMNEASDAGLADGVGVSFINQYGEIAAVNVSTTVADLKPSLGDIAKISITATALHEKIRSTFSERELIHLTEREKDVLSWAAEGKTDGEIAILLGVTHHAVRFHWNNIFRKMDVNSKMLATMMAVRLRLVEPALIRPESTRKKRD